jgi:hypothetical protein
MNAYDTERLARLLSALPVAPHAWVKAAQQLPAARRELEQIVARAEADAAFRAQLVADLESALAEAGYEPAAPLLDALRDRLSRS